MSSTKDEYKMFTYLGQKIKNEALKASACMDSELREAIGAIKMYTALTGDPIFESYVVPLAIYARYLWHRMEVTDLSLMLGENVRHVGFKDGIKSGSKERNGDLIREAIEEDL